MAKKESVLADVLNKYAAEREVSMISTGSLAVDVVIGGGIYHGGFYAFWGPQGSGKTTVAAQVANRFLRKGEKCAWIDVEKAFNKQQQEAFGVREYVESGQMLYLTADNYVDLDTICMALAEESDVKLVVIDSETMLLPALGKDVDVASQQPGQKARQASLTLTKAKSAFYKAGIASIWLFHARANINMSNPNAPQEKMAGGFTQKHIPDCILKITAGQKIGDKGAPIGQIIHLETEKNKFTKPFQKLDTELTYGKGIELRREVIQFAIDQGIIKQGGSFFTLPDGSSVRGREALYDLDKEVLKSIKSQISIVL